MLKFTPLILSSKKVLFEVPWSAMKWSEAIWSEARWSDVKRLGVMRSDVKRLAVMRSDVKRRDVKRRDVKLFSYKIFKVQRLQYHLTMNHFVHRHISLNNLHILTLTNCVSQWWCLFLWLPCSVITLKIVCWCNHLYWSKARYTTNLDFPPSPICLQKLDLLKFLVNS